MTDTHYRFADYATSGAFQIGLTRGQIGALMQIARGDHNPYPHMGTIGALERKGLAQIVESSGRADQAQVRPTAAGLLVAQLCTMAGLTNAATPGLAEQVAALTDELATLRGDLFTAREDNWSLRVRLEAAELARDALQAEKDGRGFARPWITLKDRQPDKPTESMAFAKPPQGDPDNGFCPECAQPDGHPHILGCPHD